jgi:hypothetical protein
LKKFTLLAGAANKGEIAEKLGQESTPFELFSIKPVRISQRQKEAGTTRATNPHRTDPSVTSATGMTSMTALRNRLAVCAFAAACATLATSATSNAAAPRYDGVWSVSIITEKGDCDRGYRYPIRISNGILANGGSDPFTITGNVTASGAIVVTVSAGTKSANGSGRLAGNIGAGHWQGGACSGSWSAERRSS